jgi:hypothetical protein
MANHPVPDSVPDIMQQDFGTRVLITSPIADRYLKMARLSKYKHVPDDRYSRPCGGAGGFDDFVERWHE